MTDTLVIVGILVTMICAVVTIGVALWELGHAWWTPEDTTVDRAHDRRGGTLL